MGGFIEGKQAQVEERAGKESGESAHEVVL